MGIIEYLKKEKRTKVPPTIPPDVDEEKVDYSKNRISDRFVEIEDGVFESTQEDFMIASMNREDMDDEKSRIEYSEDKVWDSPKPINHLYRLQKGFNTWNCPKCSKELDAKYIGFIYKAGWQLRQAMGPYGRICDPCGIAVVDERQAIETSKRKTNNYSFPIAIFSMNKAVPAINELNLFRTYEGKVATYIFDEEGFLEGVHLSDPKILKSKATKEKSKKKVQRKARKASRNKNKKKH